MREKPYLLTYTKENRTDFEWFESEEEMNDFLEGTDVEVLDKIYIPQAVDLK